jgi:prefoldin subunit 5
MTGYVDEDVYSLIDDLCSKIDELQEQIEDMEENIRENYKPISPYEFYGVSERLFH